MVQMNVFQNKFSLKKKKSNEFKLYIHTSHPFLWAIRQNSAREFKEECNK